MEKIMSKIALLSEVAILAEEIEFSTNSTKEQSKMKKMERNLKSHVSKGWLLRRSHITNNSHGVDSNDDDSSTNMINTEYLIEESFHYMEDAKKEDFSRRVGNNNRFNKGVFFRKNVKPSDKKVNKIIQGRGENDYFEAETLLGSEWKEIDDSQSVSSLVPFFVLSK